MTGHLVSHVFRRGLQHFTNKQEFINKLEQDAQLYENAGPEMEVKPQEFLPVFITGLLALVAICSIDYVIGHVISALAMIESPSSIAIIEAKPPAYSEEPDAPLEKEPLMVAEAEPDVEVTVINHKPITAKITTSVGHLQRIGGFRARWRGLGLFILYHFIHAVLTNFLAAMLGFGIIGESLMYIFVSVGLCRLHLAWTHKMIAYPSSQPWFRRVPARKDCKALLLPNLVYAAAQQATIILPIGVAFALGVAPPPMHHLKHAAHHDCSKLILMGLRFLAVPLTYIVVGLAVLLPASVTLTRIEATLLPEGEEAIVPFDKHAMIGDIDLSARGGARALFVQAWRSFDRSSRWRLIKLYAKMVMVQVTVAVIAVHLMIAEIYLIGGERIGIFLKSAAAQLKLMAIQAHEAQEQAAN